MASSGNALLDALPVTELHRLAHHVETVGCSGGSVLGEFGGPARNVFFPTSCVVALSCELEGGHSCEVGVVGAEGAVGVSVFLGGDSLPGRSQVVIGGEALRVRADTVREQFRRSAVLQRLLLRYTQALIVQISQIAVCQGRHSVEQRLARTLLLTRDRMEADDLALTQDSISAMLGVRRESVSQAAGRLHEAGAIDYARGHIRVVGRRQLETAACECYLEISREFSRLEAALRESGVDRETG